jgi:hypothetical protein
LGVEGKIIWAAERISIAFLGGMRQWFTIAVQVEDGVLACVANQMAAIGSDFVSIGSTGESKVLVGSIELKLGEGFVPRYIAFAIVIEHDAFAIARDFE